MEINSLFNDISKNITLTVIDEHMFKEIFIKNNQMNLSKIKEKAVNLNIDSFSKLDELKERQREFTYYDYVVAVDLLDEAIEIASETEDIVNYLEEYHMKEVSVA